LPITYFSQNCKIRVLSQAGRAFQTDLLYLTVTTFATILVGVFKIAIHKAGRDGLTDRKEEY
jgi:hypothetical protein